MFKYLRIKNKVTVFVVAMLFMFTLDGCKKEFDNPQSDSLAVYDELWNFMDKHYSMFSIKEVDWDKTYLKYKSQIKLNMTDAELFGLLNKLLFTLKDGHVSLMNKKDTATYLNFYQDYPINFNFEIVRNNYFNNDFKKAGPIFFKVVNNVGYIYYPSFSRDVSDSDLDELFKNLNETKGLIIDVRNNTGGNSTNSDKLFGRFISEKKLVKYEVFKKGTGRNDFFEPKPYYVMPAGQVYNKPIILLTNRSCFSACNDFALYLSLLPNVQIMGNQTGGGGGIPFNYILANGWKLQYSATYTLSPTMENIENGIKPNYDIDFSPQDEANGKDIIIETAFKSLDLR